MENSAEHQLYLALQSFNPLTGTRQHAAIERLVAELLGGQQADSRGGRRQPDLLLVNAESTPIAVELKVLGERSLQKNLENRVADLLAGAVETRRSFPGDVVLSAILLVRQEEFEPTGSGSGQSMTSLVRRLLRSSDGVGYDSVLIGSAEEQLRWHYYPAAPTPVGGDFQEAAALSSTGAFNLLRKQRPLFQMRPPARPKSRKQRILLVADEWRSGHGGISTVNRELASALASGGVDAAVMVPHHSEDDVRSASDSDVKLVTPARVPGLSDREALLLRPVFADQGWEPDVIVGHGRLLGPYAAAQQQQFFPKALRVHFVHTDAEQLEAAKETPGGESHMANADRRRRLECDLARSADLVVGVGPLLSETIRDDLIGPGPESKVICMIPGLRTTFDVASALPPVTNRILIVGRADDFQSKGIDIAAEAILKVVDRWPPAKPHRPVLVIRGVPDESAAAVKADLDSIFEGRVSYTLRPYSDSEDDVLSDLAQARILLMPSRHEGFGLSAYEAIASGVPVLISSESGLAQFLRESQIDTSPSSIISPRNSSTRLATDQWADAIERVIEDASSARAQAVQLREAIGHLVSWKQSTAALLTELNGPS